MRGVIEIFHIWKMMEVIIKMELNDVEALSEMSNNDNNIYRFIPPFLYKKVTSIRDSN